MARRRRNPTDDRLRRAQTGRGGDELREAVRSGRVIAPCEGRYPVIETIAGTTYREYFALRERVVPLGPGHGVREFTAVLGVTVELHVPPPMTEQPLARVRAWWSGSPGGEATWVIRKAGIPDPWWTEPSIQAWLRHAVDGTQPPGSTVPVPRSWNPGGDERERRARRDASGGDVEARLRAEAEVLRREGIQGVRARVPWQVGDDVWDDAHDPLLVLDNEAELYEMKLAIERYLDSGLVLGDFDRGEAFGLFGSWASRSPYARQNMRSRSLKNQWTNGAALEAVARFLDRRRTVGGMDDDELVEELQRPLLDARTIHARDWVGEHRLREHRLREHRLREHRLRGHRTNPPLQWQLTGHCRQGDHESCRGRLPIPGQRCSCYCHGRYSWGALKGRGGQGVARSLPEGFEDPSRLPPSPPSMNPGCRRPGRRRCSHRTLVYVPRPDLGPGHQEERCHACGALLDLVTPATAHPRPPGPQQLKQLPGGLG